MNGWYKPLNELCNLLESLNKIYYLKYNIRIQADQIKEKYGTLHFYFSIIIDPPKYKRILVFPFKFIDYLLDHVAFKFKTKRVLDPYTEIKWEEISKEKYELKQKPENIKNYEHSEFKQEGEKYYRSYEQYNPGKFETKLLNHKLLWKIKCFCVKQKQKFYIIKPNKTQIDLSNILNNIVDKLIDDCEKQCYDLCEICGTNQDLITTSGWIKRICKSCNEKG